MSDHLRDAFRDAMPGDKQFAEKLADAIREVIDKRITARGVPGGFELEAAKPQPAEPRQNPYEDWASYGELPSTYTARVVQKMRYDAWNEGAQSAGERDE